MKLIGLVTVFTVCTCAGFIKANGYKRSENELRAFLELVYFIKREISSYLTPQHEIYRKFSNPVLEKNGFLHSLVRISDNGTQRPLYHVLECRRSFLTVTDEAFNVLSDFSSELGTLSTYDECQRCDRTAIELEEILQRQKEETGQKATLCKSIGSLVGIGLVLLLW